MNAPTRPDERVATYEPRFWQRGGVRRMSLAPGEAVLRVERKDGSSYDVDLAANPKIDVDEDHPRSFKYGNGGGLLGLASVSVFVANPLVGGAMLACAGLMIGKHVEGFCRVLFVPRLGAEPHTNLRIIRLGVPKDDPLLAEFLDKVRRRRDSLDAAAGGES